VRDQQQRQARREPEELKRPHEARPAHVRDLHEREPRHEVARGRREDVREPVAELVREDARLARHADEVSERGEDGQRERGLSAPRRHEIAQRHLDRVDPEDAHLRGEPLHDAREPVEHAVGHVRAVEDDEDAAREADDQRTPRDPRRTLEGPRAVPFPARP
jgi:hypothetical protein